MTADSSPKNLSPNNWNADFLDAARQDADPLADALASKLFEHAARSPEGRLGYNRLVSIADLLESRPELTLIQNSRLSQTIAEYPDALRDYYDPLPAPEWVDPVQLKEATLLWKNNSLAMLGVLYAASLPACYLMRNGIPALYQTAKLRDHQYIFQRIYETGVMLESVLRPGGIRVIEDLPDTPQSAMLEALRELDSTGNWEFQNQVFSRTANSVDLPFSPSELAEAVTRAKSANRIKNGRYLWGPGYIQAKKVRLLHASMRVMLLHPEVVGRPQAQSASPRDSRGGVAQAIHGRSQPEAWPSAQIGKPVNQEDLAFTLLTFGYLIPKGLEQWGCELSLTQKQAFLHLWRVIGYTMGLREDLMTDQWDRAESLYQSILGRQGGHSEQGVALTEAVMWFLRSYLPEAFGIRAILPVVLIADLLGEENASKLMSPQDQQHLRSAHGRILRLATHSILLIYYRYYQGILELVPPARRLFGTLFERVSDALIQSWRGEFRREPFFIPATEQSWELRSGVDAAFSARLQRWRVQLLETIFWALFSLFCSGLFGAAALAALLWKSLPWAWGGLGLFLISLGNALYLMDVRLDVVCAGRPKPETFRSRS
jgi:hypothetical protein